MTTRITKGLRFEVKDAEKGIVEAVFARFNVKDLDDDWTVPEAFENGAAVLISSYNHKSWWDAMPVGRGTIRVDQDKAVLVGQFFMTTDAGRETFETVKLTGELQEWSYGFDILATGVVTEEMRQVGVRRVISKVKVFEVSPVLIGAGVDTETLSVKGRKETAPPAAPTADPATATAARQELVQFEKTRARLVRIGAGG